MGSTDGTFSWLPMHVVDTGWGSYSHVFAGDNGVIFAVQSSGDLLWRRHLGNPDGEAAWYGPFNVGSGWQIFSHVFSGGDGILYAIEADGTLRWYKYLEAENSWLGPLVVGTGWQNFAKVFGGRDGAIYGINPNGDLVWYRHLGRETGVYDWSGPVTVGTGWDLFTHVFASADGVIYGVLPDGRLQWYKHLGFQSGAATWLGPIQVGTGWIFDTVFAAVEPTEGYCWPLSAAPGETVSFKISSPSSFDARVVRFQRSGEQNQPIGMTSWVTYPPALPATPDSAWVYGCGWPETVSLEIPANWTSGIYALECRDPQGHSTWIDFIVKPDPASLGHFAIVANTNTWNAYNPWGGRSKYQPAGAVARAVSYLRPNPGTAPIDAGGLNHLTRAELWVHDWLSTTGYRFDTYTDVDFHGVIVNLSQYKALLLHTHPEYWTPEMMEILQGYLAAGGSVLYLAGNGLFEEVLLSPDRTLMTLFPAGQYPDRNPSAFRNLSPNPRPERAILGVAYVYDCFRTWDAFRVLDASHPLFTGTGVADGALIGVSGINGGGASGWEMDTMIAGTAPDGVIVSCSLGDDRGAAPPGTELIARGNNPCGLGGDMTYYRTGNGGFVFAAGSLSFGGSLVVDPVLQRVVENALFLAHHGVTAVEIDSSEEPRFSLERSQPNPFSSVTTIRYSTSVSGSVSLVVYDVHGREVTRLVSRAEPAGNHVVRWNGRTSTGDLAAAGVYFYRLGVRGSVPPSGAEISGILTGRVVLLR